MESSPDELTEALEISRKITALKTSVLHQPVVQFLESHMLTHLELTKLTIEKHRLAEILAHVANATSLEFHGIVLEIDSSLGVAHPVAVSNLKRIKICNSDTAILSLISSTSLIEFSSRRQHEQSASHDEVNLLAQQKMLRSLRLENSFDTFFIENMASFDFKLQKLTIINGNAMEILSFLQLQKQSLEEIKIWGIGRYALVLLNFPNLKSLTAERLSLKFGVPAVTKLEHLSAKFFSRDRDEARRFFLLTRNLKAFETRGGLKYDRFFAILHGMESLAIRESAKFNTDTVFGNLKELKFTHIWDNEAILNKIIQNHSQTLEKLSIEFISDGKLDRGSTYDVIKSCKNLRWLSVGCTSWSTLKKLGQIEFDHPWTLEVFFNKIDSETKSRNFLNEYHWYKVVYKFPDDSSLFKTESFSDEDVIRNVEFMWDAKRYQALIEKCLDDFIEKIFENFQL